MSFAFGFSGDDIESDDGTSNDAGLVTAMGSSTLADPNPLIPPRAHTLEELLRDLPSQISYNYLHVPLHSSRLGPSNNGAQYQSIPRRSVFDMKTQLMAEASMDDDNVTDNDTLLSGLEHGDLTSGFYEGGFKTWECAVDLAGLVASEFQTDADMDLHVIEIGAGSAIPSLTLMQKALKDGETGRRVHFTLCDYNIDVLRLATASNVFLADQACGTRNGIAQDTSEQEIEDINETMIAETMSRFDNAGISVSFISGAWGVNFSEMTMPPASFGVARKTQTLVLASETIYSPASIAIFNDTLISILRRCQRVRALVAAKKVYFGVGGSVQMFAEDIVRKGLETIQVLDVKNAGVGRVVLEVVTK